MEIMGLKFGDKGNSLSLKLLIIGFLLLVFLPAIGFVYFLVEDRSSREQSAIYEVSSKWGERQVLKGPILAVPLKTKELSYAYFLPESLSVEATADSETRSRGIYDVPLYQAKIAANGSFASPNFSTLGLNNENADLANAFFIVGISDIKGLKSRPSFEVNGANVALSAGDKSGLVGTGLSSKFALDPQVAKYDFSLDLVLNGSSELGVSPLAKETVFELKSDWLSPSFSGDFLPIERELNDKGFQAKWQVLELNRSLPQQWLSTDVVEFGSKYNEYGDGTMLGVEFLKTADNYTKVERAVKYAIVVIMLVFLTIFLMEVLASYRVHPFQYILVGLALVIFYALLLSLSEYWRFGWAYLTAVVATVGLITWFVNASLQNTRHGLILGSVLTGLYGFVYVLLLSADYTLLMGSVAVFVLLAVVMYVTRKIDWYKA